MNVENVIFIIYFSNGTASVVTSIFGGILQNEVNCLICGTESRKFDPFLGMNLIKLPSISFNCGYYYFLLNTFCRSAPESMTVLLSSDLSLDIPSQFRQKRSKDQEPGPACTLRGKCPAVLADGALPSVFTLTTAVYIPSPAFV